MVVGFLRAEIPVGNLALAPERGKTVSKKDGGQCAVEACP